LISKLKTSISFTDIEGAFFDIDKSSTSGHVDIDVLTFDIDNSSISYWFDIKVVTFSIEVSQNLGIRNRRSKPVISNCHIVPDIEGHFQDFDIEDCTFAPSKSGDKDIEGPTFDTEGRQGSRW
jgi:hypothetical protein